VTDPEMTHTGTGAQQYVIAGPDPPASVTITFPDSSGYLISAEDYADFKAMLAEYRLRMNIHRLGEEAQP
jgi:hypothetical protein